MADIEYCKNPECGKPVEVMAHKGTGYCGQDCRKKCEPEPADQHGLNLVRLTREEQQMVEEARNG